MNNTIDIVQTHLLTIRRVSKTRWELCLKSDQTPVGTMHTPSSGWHVEIEPGHRRQGLAKQALTALLVQAQDSAGVRARIDPGNDAGRRLLHACGFRSDDDSRGHFVGPSAAIAASQRDSLQREAAAAYPRELAELHRRLMVPGDYAKAHQLEPVAEAEVLTSIGRDIFDRPQHLTPDASDAWASMVAAAAGDQVSLRPVSAYRSVAYQAHIVERKLESGQTPDTVFSVSAAPGFSEHHSGNAIDLSDGEGEPLVEAFEETAAFGWLTAHAQAYGFYLSFPRDNPHKLIYEPWHWCFRPATH